LPQVHERRIVGDEKRSSTRYHAPMSDPLHAAWALDPGITFLNHGSFGACPRAVLETQQRLRARMEAEPVRFFMRDLEGLLDGARRALAAFVGAHPADLAFVPNTTAGVNAVLRSCRLEAGDEIVLTDHVYNACRNAAEFAAARTGARTVVATVPCPLRSPGEVVDAVLAVTGAKTRLALLDHVTSPTGIVFPIERLVAALAARGVEVLVDGAHAPGMLPLDLRAIGAAYYVGNCHKWLCSPKGAGFVHVRRDRQADVRPVAISHGANSPRTDRSRFLLEFDWTGTADPTPYLCVPAALDCIEGLVPGGWPAAMARNRALALEARALLARALGAAPLAPDEMVGSLAALPMPDATTRAAAPIDPLQDVLIERYGIEVPVFPWPAHPRRLVRVSAHLYNTRADYERLATALGTLLAAPETRY
jgi:isopenicillin-N epimerase